MEYAKFTDGHITIIVIDQDNPEFAAWKYAIKVKIGKKRFSHLNSHTCLKSALTEAMYEFSQVR